MSHGGKAAHDALQRLAISVDPPRAFVDRDVRAASLRRLRDDAVGECLRIFQLCATPTLGLEGNLRLVLAPCVRWCVCARLLRAVGRRVDEAVRRDVAAAVAAVAAAAHSRAERDEDDDQRCDGLAPPDGPNGPTRHRCPVERTIERTRTVHSRRRRDRSTAGASQTLVEDAERVVTALADQMLGGWKGAPAERGAALPALPRLAASEPQQHLARATLRAPKRRARLLEAASGGPGGELRRGTK